MLCKEFFQAFANEAGANLHVKLEYGGEPHHVTEGAFKCFARVLRAAVKIDTEFADSVPSTKGVL